MYLTHIMTSLNSKPPRASDGTATMSRKRSGAVFKCQRCQTYYRGRQVIEQHVHERHRGADGKSGQFMCSVCSEQVPGPGQLKAHFRRAHPGTRIAASVMFSRNSNAPKLEWIGGRNVRECKREKYQIIIQKFGNQCYKLNCTH